MRSLLSTLLSTLTLLLSTQAFSDTLKIPVGSQGEGLEKPSLGLTMDSVKSRYGAPEKVSGPTGEPPITRWDYPQFSVYFEYDSVLHSVTKHTPVITAPDAPAQ